MTDAVRPPRVLIVAENASTRFGGESFLPFHYFRVLRARGVETWLLCHQRVADEVQQAFPNEFQRLFFVTDSRVQRLLWRASQRLPAWVDRTLITPVAHLLTQVAQRDVARRLVAELKIDVVHEPIPVSPRQPSALHRVGAPTVIGPMNGGMSYPEAYLQMEGRAERAVARVGYLLADVLNRVIPGKRRAALLLVANQRTRDALPAVLREVPVMELAENGVDLSRFRSAPRESPQGTATRIAFVGRLIDLKGVDILLDALASIQRPPGIELEIVGDGPARAALEQQMCALGLSSRVRFYGFVSQDHVPKILAQSDILVLPSLRECGGAVVLEAMALRLPVIATRWGGPSQYLDETCGVLIEPTPRPQFVRSLARAISDLAVEPARRKALGDAGRAKVERVYDWDRKIDRILEIYQLARSTGGERAPGRPVSGGRE